MKQDVHLVLTVLLFVLVFLFGCASEPKEMAPPSEGPNIMFLPGPERPVPVPCKLDEKTKAQRPVFGDDNQSLAAIPDVEAGSRLMKAALAQYHFWVKTLESSLDACVK